MTLVSARAGYDGSDEGNNFYRVQWSDGSIELDIRVKVAKTDLLGNELSDVASMQRAIDMAYEAAEKMRNTPEGAWQVKNWFSEGYSPLKP